MVGAEWLQNQLTSFSWSSCGRPSRSSHLAVVAQRLVMHEFLDRFDGDFQRLFDGPSGSGPGVGA
ncbi:MAG: hypothetical protein H0W07_09025 [Chloroflexi bacterium]|nr:hypothetical protein [Chloroflexota bacterium]